MGNPTPISSSWFFPQRFLGGPVLPTRARVPAPVTKPGAPRSPIDSVNFAKLRRGQRGPRRCEFSSSNENPFGPAPGRQQSNEPDVSSFSRGR